MHAPQALSLNNATNFNTCLKMSIISIIFCIKSGLIIPVVFYQKCGMAIFLIFKEHAIDLKSSINHSSMLIILFQLYLCLYDLFDGIVILVEINRRRK